jgi:hypothetical protein
MEETKRKAPQNLGHILLPAGFFQVVLLIRSFLYLLFLFIGKPYCSFPLILAMYLAWQIPDVRGAKQFQISGSNFQILGARR